MRYLLILLLVFSGFEGFAQQGRGELLPRVKPGKKIDSLLSIDINSLHSINNDKVFVVNLQFMADTSISIDISQFKKSAANFMVSRFYKLNYEVGYFEYKGYLIFLLSSAEIHDLFVMKKKLRSFDFLDFSLKRKAQEEILLPDALSMYFFRKGHIKPFDITQLGTGSTDE